MRVVKSGGSIEKLVKVSIHSSAIKSLKTILPLFKRMESKNMKEGRKIEKNYSKKRYNISMKDVLKVIIVLQQRS